MSCDAIIIWQVGTTNLPLPHGLLTMEQSDSTERLGLPRKKIMGGLFWSIPEDFGISLVFCSWSLYRWPGHARSWGYTWCFKCPAGTPFWDNGRWSVDLIYFQKDSCWWGDVCFPFLCPLLRPRPWALKLQWERPRAGRISRLSRKVGFRLVNLRVAERYFLKIHALLKTRKVNKIWAGKKKRRRNWNFIESYAMFGLVVADDFHTSYKKFLKGHLASTYPIRLHPFPAISPQSYAWWSVPWPSKRCSWSKKRWWI